MNPPMLGFPVAVARTAVVGMLVLFRESGLRKSGSGVALESPPSTPTRFDARTMIYYLVTPEHPSTVTKFLRTRGAPLAPILRVVAYPAGVLEGARRVRDWVPLRRYPRTLRGFVEQSLDSLGALRRHAPRPAAFIFSDLERLSAPERERAAALWTGLAERGLARKRLNHPLRALRRYG